MDSAPRAIPTSELRPTAVIAARRQRRVTMGLPFCLFLGACQGSSAPSDAGSPAPLAVSSAALYALPAPPTALLTFEASRRSDVPAYWLPESWYCRLVNTQNQGQSKKEQEELEKNARADSQWERRRIDIFSWDSFLAINWPYFLTINWSYYNWPYYEWPYSLAINWPYDQESWKWLPREDGGGDQPSMAFGNEYRPYWAGWHRLDELDELETNANVLSPLRPWRCEGPCLRSSLNGEAKDAPVWDQNGAEVEYEIRVNASWMTSRPKESEIPTFTYGQCERGGDQFTFVPAVEIKLAWKVLGAGDVPERFFTMRGVKVPPDQSSADLGLVGMHIASKVKNRNWIAMTFEHVDNVPFDTPPEQERNRWSFHSLSCSGCCENGVPPEAEPRRTQLTRTEPINQDTQELNREVQGWLKARGSVWQYYELVGSQYHLGKPTGDVDPKKLRNTVIEPYMIEQSASHCPLPNGQEASCLGCHKVNADELQDFSFIPPFHSPQTKSP